MLRERDRDADGRISANEFGEDRAEEFKKLDANNDGFLSPDEISRGLPQRDGNPPGDRRRRPETGDSPKKDEPKKDKD